MGFFEVVFVLVNLVRFMKVGGEWLGYFNMLNVGSFFFIVFG